MVEIEESQDAFGQLKVSFFDETKMAKPLLLVKTSPQSAFFRFEPTNGISLPLELRGSFSLDVGYKVALTFVRNRAPTKRAKVNNNLKRRKHASADPVET